MLTAKRRGRHGHRDATMILIAYRHGLRVGELCALRWDQVDFDRGFLHVRRLKQGIPSVHPLRVRLSVHNRTGRPHDHGRVPQDADTVQRDLGPPQHNTFPEFLLSILKIDILAKFFLKYCNPDP